MLSQNEALKLKSADLEVTTTAKIGRNALTDLRKLLQDLGASSDTRPLGEILQDGKLDGLVHRRGSRTQYAAALVLLLSDREQIVSACREHLDKELPKLGAPGSRTSKFPWVSMGASPIRVVPTGPRDGADYTIADVPFETRDALSKLAPTATETHRLIANLCTSRAGQFVGGEFDIKLGYNPDKIELRLELASLRYGRDQFEHLERDLERMLHEGGFRVSIYDAYSPPRSACPESVVRKSNSGPVGMSLGSTIHTNCRTYDMSVKDLPKLPALLERLNGYLEAQMEGREYIFAKDPLLQEAVARFKEAASSRYGVEGLSEEAKKKFLDRVDSYLEGKEKDSWGRLVQGPETVAEFEKGNNYDWLERNIRADREKAREESLGEEKYKEVRAQEWLDRQQEKFDFDAVQVVSLDSHRPGIRVPARRVIRQDRSGGRGIDIRALENALDHEPDRSPAEWRNEQSYHSDPSPPPPFHFPLRPILEGSGLSVHYGHQISFRKGTETVPLADAVQQLRTRLLASLEANINGQHKATLVALTPLEKTCTLKPKLDVGSVHCESVDDLRYALLAICAGESGIKEALKKTLPRIGGLQRVIDNVKGVSSASDIALIDGIMEELQRNGRYDHHFDYAGMGTSFLKTSVRITPNEGDKGFDLDIGPTAYSPLLDKWSSADLIEVAGLRVNLRGLSLDFSPEPVQSVDGARCTVLDLRGLERESSEVKIDDHSSYFEFKLGGTTVRLRPRSTYFYTPEMYATKDRVFLVEGKKGDGFTLSLVSASDHGGKSLDYATAREALSVIAKQLNVFAPKSSRSED